MKQSPWRKVEQAARNLVPLSLTLILLLIGLLPLQIPAYGQVAPALALMGIYYWAVHRPDLMNAPAAFAIGLLNDLVTGGPVGVNSLVMVLVQLVCATQGRFLKAKSFLVTWWGFAMVALPAVIASWLIGSALSGSALPVKTTLFYYLFTVAVFPVIGWVMIRAHTSLLRPAEL